MVLIHTCIHTCIHTHLCDCWGGPWQILRGMHVRRTYACQRHPLHNVGRVRIRAGLGGAGEVARDAESRELAFCTVSTSIAHIYIYICIYIYIYTCTCMIMYTFDVYLYTSHTYDIIWYDMIWYGILYTVCYDVLWYNMVRYDIIWHAIHWCCRGVGLFWSWFLPRLRFHVSRFWMNAQYQVSNTHTYRLLNLNMLSVM